MKLRFVLHGSVQGVGCRAFVKRIARELKVRGQVKNLDDGTVEIYAEADPEVLEMFKQHVQAGDGMIEVTKIDEFTEGSSEFRTSATFDAFEWVS